jgi:hypothetical protein
LRVTSLHVLVRDHIESKYLELCRRLDTTIARCGSGGGVVVVWGGTTTVTSALILALALRVLVC